MKKQKDRAIIAFQAPPELKRWVEEQAAQEQRTPSNWLRIRVEKMKADSEAAAG